MNIKNMLPEETRKLFVEWGRQGGKKLLKEKGKDYFRQMALKREAEKRGEKLTCEQKNSENE